MLLHPLWTTSVLGLLAVSTGASGSEEHQSMKLVKRDPSGVPATVSHQNCATRYFNRLGSSHLDPVCNLGIQAGECFVNARIHNNVFATFEPQDGPMTASREGGPYGICCAHSVMPKAEDVIEVMNPNYFCFAWEGTGKVIGAGLPDGGLPGMLAWPYPLICPGPQPNCYSLAYFDPMKAGDDIGQHKMAAFGGRYPNTTAMYMPPKRPGERGTKRPFEWCNGRGLGCPLTTNRLFQTQNLGNLGCDPTKCLPYKGDTTILQGNDRSTYAKARGSAVAGIKSCNPQSDPWCGGPRLSGFGGQGGSGTTSSGTKTCDPKVQKCVPNEQPPVKSDPKKCDKKINPTCGQSSTSPPVKQCDPNVDGNCKPKTTDPTQCDPSKNSNCKQDKSKSTQPPTGKLQNTPEKQKKDCKKDGSCKGEKGSGSPSKGMDTEGNFDCETGTEQKQKTTHSTKRDGIQECDAPRGEDCGHQASHKRHSITHMKSGWIV